MDASQLIRFGEMSFLFAFSLGGIYWTLLVPLVPVVSRSASTIGAMSTMIYLAKSSESSGFHSMGT